MYCPPGHIAEDTLPAVQFHITRYQCNPVFPKKKKQSCSLCLQLYVSLLPTLCPMLGACGSCMSKLGSQFRQTGDCFSSHQQGELSHLAASGPLDVLQKDGRSMSSLWEGRGGSPWSERIWADTQHWPQRFHSVAASQPGAEGSDLWRACKSKTPSHGRVKPVKPNSTYLIWEKKGGKGKGNEWWCGPQLWRWLSLV